jgi:hypothetical protein
MWEDLVVEDKFIRVSVAKGLQSNRINAVMLTSRQIHIDVESASRTSATLGSSLKARRVAHKRSWPS